MLICLPSPPVPRNINSRERMQKQILCGSSWGKLYCCAQACSSLQEWGMVWGSAECAWGGRRSLLPNLDPHRAELMMFVTSFMKASSNPLHETDQTKTHFPSLSIWLRRVMCTYKLKCLSILFWIKQIINKEFLFWCFDVKRNICYVHVKV